MRFIHQLGALAVIILVVSSSAGLYASFPYQLHMRILYDVNVSAIDDWANFLNATFTPIKDYSIGACNNNSQPVYLPRGNPFKGEKPLNKTATLTVNLTLARDGIPITGGECKIDAHFNTLGEYYLTISPVIYYITPGTYSITMFYRASFNATTTFEILSWNATLEVL
ncbi:MAG: hypothetical protein ACHQ03_10395 [Candidatus Bathyarchaeia archaeon]